MNWKRLCSLAQTSKLKVYVVKNKTLFLQKMSGRNFVPCKIISGRVWGHSQTMSCISKWPPSLCHNMLHSEHNMLHSVTICYTLSTICYTLSTICYTLSTICYTLSTTCYTLSTIGYTPSTICYTLRTPHPKIMSHIDHSTPSVPVLLFLKCFPLKWHSIMTHHFFTYLYLIFQTMTIVDCLRLSRFLVNEQEPWC